MRLLVIEDDEPLADAIREALTAPGRTIDLAHDAIAGNRLRRLHAYDLLILDVMLPHGSGLDICRTARAEGVDSPILMLTALDSLSDKVQGFDAGADDYLAKPFEIEELKLRVRALLRRNTPRREGVLRVGDLTLDPVSGRVDRGGKPLKLMPKEFTLLEILLRNVGRIVPHAELHLGLWSTDAEQSPGALRTHVKQLRKAIGDTERPQVIQSIHGRGYRIDDNALES